jgi:hypothetical protein
MQISLRESLANREKQWRAFRQWKLDHGIQPLSVQERVAWYASAFRLSRRFSKPIGADEIESRVRQIQDVRARLSHLK